MQLSGLIGNLGQVVVNALQSAEMALKPEVVSVSMSMTPQSMVLDVLESAQRHRPVTWDRVEV